MNLTADDITEAKRLIQELGLKGGGIVLNAPGSLLRKVCNGVGPSWFPEKLRMAVSKLHKSMNVPSMIHDMEYLFGDGTRLDFQKANEHFLVNSQIMSRYMYGWYNPVRYMALSDARKFRRLLDDFGWPAYVAAIKERPRILEANADAKE